MSSKEPNMLPGRTERGERELEPHWLRNRVGGGIPAWVFNALFHCCRVCFPAGSAQGGGYVLLADTIALFPQSDCPFVKMSFSCNHSLDGSFPPSPAEDRGSKRLSWGSLLQRLTELKGISQRVAADHQCSRSENGECCSSIVCFIGWIHTVTKKHIFLCTWTYAL